MLFCADLNLKESAFNYPTDSLGRGLKEVASSLTCPIKNIFRDGREGARRLEGTREGGTTSYFLSGGSEKRGQMRDAAAKVAEFGEGE